MVSLSSAVLIGIAATILTGVITWVVKGNIDAESFRQAIAHKETAPIPYPVMSTENEDEKAISTLERRDGVLYKSLFSREILVTMLFCALANRVRLARGTIYVPTQQPVKLIVKDMVLVSSPKFFLRFEPDSIAELDISNNLGVSDTTSEYFTSFKIA